MASFKGNHMSLLTVIDNLWILKMYIFKSFVDIILTDVHIASSLFKVIFLKLVSESLTQHW